MGMKADAAAIFDDDVRRRTDAHAARFTGLGFRLSLQQRLEQGGYSYNRADASVLQVTMHIGIRRRHVWRHVHRRVDTFLTALMRVFPDDIPPNVCLPHLSIHPYYTLHACVTSRGLTQSTEPTPARCRFDEFLTNMAESWACSFCFGRAQTEPMADDSAAAELTARTHA